LFADSAQAKFGHGVGHVALDASALRDRQWFTCGLNSDLITWRKRGPSHER